MYCKNCGNQIPPGARTCPNCHSVLRRRVYLLLVPLILVAVAACIGIVSLAARYSKYRALEAKLEEAVGKDAGYTETIIRVEAEASSMTYVELFDLCQKSIDLRTQLIVELRGLYPNLKSDVRAMLIDFLNSENELVRQKSSYYRKNLNLNTALKLYTDYISDYPTSSYGWDYYNRRTSELKTEMSKAAHEMDEVATNYVVTYKGLINQEAQLATAMSKRGIRFVTIFQNYEKSNMGIEETAKAILKNLGV